MIYSQQTKITIITYPDYPREMDVQRANKARNNITKVNDRCLIVCRYCERETNGSLFEELIANKEDDRCSFLHSIPHHTI
jgi:hypothetical protein